ncbi:Excalibur calcium-binding domain-containing protein [Paenibacillus sp. UNC496MF]|uniref:phospholipase D-like domain-containing protein n=1 Tax=Paenibacillus sp. UNC496MF TaxID=1502753 RepID=UPI0008E8DA1C|nr:phospholipase D-like domain-containing protein [Paenibacillus sp. UNC496MF]SFJ12048.1 Excalibur calcium-binding domain-containing protein [Paenibacillus sp. UNC496MF]
MKRIAIVLTALLTVFAAGCSLSASPSATAPAGQDGIQAEWAFTQAGQQPEKLLIGVVDGAERTLDIAIYSLTKPDIVDAIKRAKNRGVAVRLITDRIQAQGKSQKEALKLLGSAGVPMKLNTHGGLMHLKMTIADGKTATTGSFNYSKAASTDNDEVLMVLRDEGVAESFARQFESMWTDTSAFAPIAPSIASGTAGSPPDESVESPTEAPADAEAPNESGAAVFRSCAEAKAAGKAPLRRGDPGYSAKMDGDGDGVACEK